MWKEHVYDLVFFPGGKMFMVKMLLEIVIKQCVEVFHMHLKDFFVASDFVGCLSDLLKCILSV